MSDYKVKVKFETPGSLTERWFWQSRTFVAERDAESMATKLVRIHGAVEARVYDTEYDPDVDDDVVTECVTSIERSSY